MDIGFGDRVQFIDSEYTRQVGVANKLGECYGHTAPSVTDIEYIGERGDLAMCVILDDDSEIWASPEQLILVDHNEGLVMEVGNIKATRNADGSWTEEYKKPKFKNWLSKLFKR